MSIRTYVYDNLNAEERVEILKRPRVDFTSILGTVAPIWLAQSFCAGAPERSVGGCRLIAVVAANP